MRPRVRRSSVLTPLEEAAVVEFRRRTLLSLDDGLGRLRDTLSRLSRSALHRPWTNGQAERMVRTVKEATVRTFHYDTHVALATHLSAFVTAYNFARHPKGLRWRTPFQAVCDAWARDPTPFKVKPYHLIPGPNT